MFRINGKASQIGRWLERLLLLSDARSSSVRQRLVGLVVAIGVRICICIQVHLGVRIGFSVAKCGRFGIDANLARLGCVSRAY